MLVGRGMLGPVWEKSGTVNRNNAPCLFLQWGKAESKCVLIQWGQEWKVFQVSEDNGGALISLLRGGQNKEGGKCSIFFILSSRPVNAALYPHNQSTKL